ncbi:ATP-dependent DNA helicase RecG [Reichenbachiella carrageenanivorans]|uniref:ATP-dependent DNA helicase RecG n=1 Tax=Reichenbachiella carrageenanivorans TaxID=2979869 RepID=A0ABY6D284_9BACT|nr:ATP-dependent DNA helicase RecG [Reichenbachiella carrageenanivorans]UXX80275.1 ATP-dependent DNA helicase RecG [Reichenbachiella carrageenanivorans]
MSGFMDTKIEFLKGVGPAKAKLLHEELGIQTFHDLIYHFPFRYEDRSQFLTINQISSDGENVQIKGVIDQVEIVGAAGKQRLTASFRDQTGQIELIWFKGVKWMKSKLKPGVPYIVYGKPSLFQTKYSISHPEIEILTPANETGKKSLLPVYATTEKLKRKYVDSKAIAKMQFELLQAKGTSAVETLDNELMQIMGLMDLNSALRQIHFPLSMQAKDKALERLKFDELFFIQLKIFKEKTDQKEAHRGIVFQNSSLVHDFYTNHKPFELTDSQKQVIKEIYTDLQSGYQMNRLLQGDVGSGKTITAFVCMLIAIGSGFQTTIMAPTEILAIQHHQGLEEYCDKLGLKIRLITGSTKKSNRRKYLEELASGEVNILVGTHALIENDVQFNRLGLAVIDEQHRFGVAQRAKLWQKNKHVYPHVLVMTATPIPRTLAMTLYGDLEVSTIRELPKGRKPIKTSHLYDSSRLKLFGFIQREIDLGRQVYIVYPLIEESSTLDYKDLMDGYESIARAFPKVPLSILHGKMKPKDKDFEMDRFVRGETKIMVATTVIEVGVNVPNASVMVIENSERFGLSQLHQLRGRVGRGADQSYCVLMTGSKISKTSRERIGCMVATTDGFEIAEKDLELRGPGDLMGTQQSGLLDLKVADLTTDGELLKRARRLAEQIIAEDPDLERQKHVKIARHLNKNQIATLRWSAIS